MSDSQEVQEVLAAFVAGELAMEKMIADFRNRDWSRPVMSSESLHRGDDVEDPENDWSHVEAHRLAGNLTDDQYQSLVDAVNKGSHKQSAWVADVIP